MLPYLKAGNETAKQYTVAFRGIHWGEDFPEGSLAHCENLTSARFPCLSQRGGRRALGVYPAPSALAVKDGLTVIHGTNVVWKGRTVGTVTPGRKQLAVVGRYLVIFPDKAYFDTEEEVFGSLEASVTVTGAVFTDASLSVQGVQLPFRVGDAVTVSGCTAAENNKTAVIRSLDGGTAGFYENTFTAGTEPGPVTLKREVPELEFICESNYRLWGVSGSTIYASKYADPFNFQVFDGLSGDSYRIDVAGEGAFTGCIPYGGHICFFKENALCKLYGSKPANFQLVISRVCGLQAGSERSLCVVNETLYYKGTGGVYAYTGGVPEPVSGCFGTRRFADACAAADAERYYLSMRGDDGWHLMTYDVLRGLWLREDGLHCVDMALCEGRVHLLDADGTLWQTEASQDRSEVCWSATFRPFSETAVNRKGYSRFTLRLEPEEGAWICAQLRRDGEGPWQTIHTSHGGRARTVSIPVLPARCDSVELRLSGRGGCLLRTLVREYQIGSDV